MQVRAVVELAILRIGFQVGHQIGQLHGLDMVQAKLLKSGRVNKGSGPRFVNPLQRSAGGGVLARIKCL